MKYVYRLQNIRCCYVDKTALSLPSLNIPAQRTTAVIGPNGSGKSTLLNLLAFLTVPDVGEICYKGMLVQKARRRKLRKQVGFLPQKPYMLRGTVADNVKIALKMHGRAKATWNDKTEAVLQQLQISHCALQQAGSLSGGELQKAALARVLVLEPEILILDEPFSYLDQTSKLFLESFMQSYVQGTGRTLLFSTHNRLQGMALADEVISLINGKCVKTPLINLFNGSISHNLFDTGNLQILLPGNIGEGSHISIDPSEIVISKQTLSSSIRNSFPGRIAAIAEERGNVRVEIQAGETFQSLITEQSFKTLDLRFGDRVWVNFKSNSVVVF